MPITFEQSKDDLAKLVKHYLTNRAQYRAGAYKEAHARQEFIDHFFIALGWDVHNTQRLAPDYREVVIEDALEIEGQNKAPDYAFRIGREKKFFAEAKRPGVDLKADPAPAYQLRRYAWSGKLPLSLLTDFEELAVYDCRTRPSPKDKASVGRIQYYTCEEYADQWRDIWEVFSREAVWGGSFDQYSQAAKGKRGTSEVDVEFLKEIEGWRDALAKNIALRNPKLGLDDLNDAVQRLIDRLIFLRMTEDRGMEEYGRLQRAAEGEHLHKRLLELSRLADAKYNSGLFDPALPQSKLLDRLTVDDKTLRSILAGLYFPDCPYEFSQIPVEILGNVYEQFLGKVIRLTAAHQAKVEEKPEVKKAGGVYYTPAYIVDYIVKHTVGAALAGRSPQQLKGFRVLDPACGSGSFLLGAYGYLLDYYRDWYSAHDPEKHKQAVQQVDGGWQLTIPERKRLLTEHIFGVDIDRQAVEVTKLSLLLKVLEGAKQMELFSTERALPNLDRNIKCGNSLIGPDYFGAQLLADPDELKRVNPFDWGKEFPEVMQAPARKLWFVTFVTHNSRVSERMVTYGVQAGTPLVFSPDDQVLIAEHILAVCRKEPIAVVAANVLPDHVHLVLAAEDEKALDEHVRKIKGASSFAFQRARGWEAGANQHVWAQKFNRVLVTDQTALANILDYVRHNHLKHVERWGEGLVATWDKGLKPLVQAACVSVEEACQPRGGFDCVIGNPPYGAMISPSEAQFLRDKFETATKDLDTYSLFMESAVKLCRPMGRVSLIVPTGWYSGAKFSTLRRFIATSTDAKTFINLPYDVFEAWVDTSVFIATARSVRTEWPRQETCTIQLRTFPKRHRITSANEFEEELTSAEMTEWFSAGGDEFLTYADSKATLLIRKIQTGSKLLQDLADVQRGVTPFQLTETKTHPHSRLAFDGTVRRYVLDRGPRKYIRFDDTLAEPKPERYFKGQRLLLRELISRQFRLQAVKATDDFVTNKSMQSILQMSDAPDLGYLLGVINSKLMSWYFLSRSNVGQRDDFPKIVLKETRSLPIRAINYSDPVDKTRHDRMVALVEKMLDLHQRKASAGAAEQERLERLMADADAQIDALVYDLYGLTEEEIRMVEGRT